MKRLIVLVYLIGGLITHSRYASAFCGVELPQHHGLFCQGVRKTGLASAKLFWRLKYDENLHGFALVDMGPIELEAHVLADPFTQHYAVNYLGMVVGTTTTLTLYNLANTGNQINNISEYLPLSEFFQNSLTGKYMDLPSKHETFFNDKTQWISDKLFTQQRLAGTNPMSIKKVTIHGEEQVGLDWNKLKELLSPEFDWDAAVQAALQTGDSLEDAIGQGRIYALRYELCDDMPRAKDKTDSDSRRAMWDFLSPIALFASANAGEYNELVPVAIQMDYKPGSAVYTPANGDNWMMAKLNVQITDLGYAQLVEHLDKDTTTAHCLHLPLLHLRPRLLLHPSVRSWLKHPEITSAALRQDNAGCYHSAAMLSACRLMGEATGIDVKRVDFSDPQGGKGPCDRKAASIKAYVR
ncbi:hypothetical protein ACROYT_G031306 [Oculina patagonica]